MSTHFEEGRRKALTNSNNHDYYPLNYNDGFCDQVRS